MRPAATPMTPGAAGPAAGPAAGRPYATGNVVDYVLALADDALVLSHRCGEWVTRAPQLEEDVALANIGLDLLGQARALLTYAGDLEGAGRDEDALAYLRSAAEYRNAIVCELPNGDFATSMARLLVASAYQLELYRALAASRDAVLSAVAAKAVKEVTYHLDHAGEWVARLGDGTDLSHRRMQAGVDEVLPLAEELFEGSWVARDLVRQGVAVDPTILRQPWADHVGGALRRSGLAWPPARALPGSGRRGEHTGALTEMLVEMQDLHRSHPGARW